MANTDIKILYQNQIISTFPKRATLNKYMLDPHIQEKIRELITLSALSFADVNDCILVDSTWFSQYSRICGAHKRKIDDRVLRLPSMAKTRKLHFVCFKDSKMILVARTTKGTTHDNKIFLEMMEEIKFHKFKIRTIIADNAYCAKANFTWLEENGIKKAFLDFKGNSIVRRSQSGLRKDMLMMWKERPDEWKETYRYRVLIESLISGLKRRGKFHYLRSKKPESQDCEMLLKVLLHNLNILAKEYFMDSSSLKG